VGKWLGVTAITIVSVGISIHCYRHLPWLDFRPYHIGANIPQGMTIPEGAPTAVFRSTVILEKTGKIIELSDKDTIKWWEDTTYVWKDTKSVEVIKGYTPPIQNFSIITAEGYEITDEVLEYEGYTFLLVAHRLSKSSHQGLEKAKNIADFCNEHGHRFYCLTASPQNEIEFLKSQLRLKYEFCFMDEVTLKTIIRANPGLVLLQKGTVLNKWHYNDMPDATDLSSNLLSFSLKQQAEKYKNRLIYGLLLGFVFLGFVFFHFRSLSRIKFRI
jgi:hypothetical protein